MDLLNIQDITVCYGQKADPAVEHFSLTVRPGERVGIVGESGSGKTTILRAVAGLLPGGGRVTEGGILFEGRPLLELSGKEWRELRGSRISMIFQDSGSVMNPIRKIGSQYTEYIRAHQKLSKKEAFEKGVEMLGRMQLPDPRAIMDSYSFQLSGGMRQRVGIAMAMTFSPGLLLADEPTSALDVTTQAQIVKEFTNLRAFGTSVIFSAHNLGVAAYMADRLIVMKNGKVEDCGSREEVLCHPSSPYTKELLATVPELGGTRYV